MLLNAKYKVKIGFSLRLKVCRVSCACIWVFLKKLSRVYLIKFNSFIFLIWLAILRKSNAINSIWTSKKLSACRIDFDIFPARFLPSAWY